MIFFFQNEDSNVVTLNSISLTTGSIVTPPTQTVQAITLSNGTTAFIQHASKRLVYFHLISISFIALECKPFRVCKNLKNYLSVPFQNESLTELGLIVKQFVQKKVSNLHYTVMLEIFL